MCGQNFDISQTFQTQPLYWFTFALVRVSYCFVSWKAKQQESLICFQFMVALIVSVLPNKQAVYHLFELRLLTKMLKFQQTLHSMELAASLLTEVA